MSRSKNTAADDSRADSRDDVDVRILQALRRLVRALDINSRRLAAKTGVTTAQLSCLKMLDIPDFSTATEIARSVHLSPSTVVGILDRLEDKSLVERARDARDRRVVRITLTRAGRRLIAETPHPVRDLLERRRGVLKRAEAERIADALECLVDLLGASELDGTTPYGALRGGRSSTEQL